LLELDHRQIWGNLLPILSDNDLDSHGYSKHQEKDAHYGMPMVSPVGPWIWSDTSMESPDELKAHQGMKGEKGKSGFVEGGFSR
jgi:hypothetical protein